MDWDFIGGGTVPFPRDDGLRDCGWTLEKLDTSGATDNILQVCIIQMA